MAELLPGHDARATAHAAACPGGLHASEDTLGDDVALHFRGRRPYLQTSAAGGRGGVHRRVERPKSDAALVELVDESDELGGPAPRPIEIEDHEDVGCTEVVEAGNESRTLGGDS